MNALTNTSLKRHIVLPVDALDESGVECAINLVNTFTEDLRESLRFVSLGLLSGTNKNWAYYLMEAPGLTHRIVSAGHQPSMQQLGSARPLSATFWMLKCNKKQD